VEALVDDLGRLSGPLTCPHGRPLLKRFTRSELDRWFKRT
jgi:DNA mismatch repair ATPase MutL